MTKEIEVFMDENNDGIIEQPNGKRGIFDGIFISDDDRDGKEE